MTTAAGSEHELIRRAKDGDEHEHEEEDGDGDEDEDEEEDGDMLVDGLLPCHSRLPPPIVCPLCMQPVVRCAADGCGLRQWPACQTSFS